MYLARDTIVRQHRLLMNTCWGERLSMETIGWSRTMLPALWWLFSEGYHDLDAHIARSPVVDQQWRLRVKRVHKSITTDKEAKWQDDHYDSEKISTDEGTSTSRNLIKIEYQVMEKKLYVENLPCAEVEMSIGDRYPTNTSGVPCGLKYSNWKHNNQVCQQSSSFLAMSKDMAGGWVMHVTGYRHNKV